MVIKWEGTRTQETGFGMRDRWHAERTAWWEVQLSHRAEAKCNAL